MFVGRDSEINLLKNYERRAGNQVMIMYGLEGVGKTTLIKEFIGDNKAPLVFSCKPLYEREQLYHYAVYDHPELGLNDYPSFEDFFEKRAECMILLRLVLIWVQNAYFSHFSLVFMKSLCYIYYFSLLDQPIHIVLISFPCL